MQLESRQTWAKWYAKELCLDDERTTALVAMVSRCSQTIMPDCEFCGAQLRQSKAKAYIPIFARCTCFDSTNEWSMMEEKRELEMKSRSMAEWEASALDGAVKSGKCPSSSVGAQWHGVERGPVGKRAERAVKDWTDRVMAGTEKKWLYLYGPRGTGKTTMAGLIVQNAIRSMVDCRYVRWSGLLYDIKAGWSDKKLPDPIEELKRVKLLVIDDFGKDAGSEWVATTAFELIDRREQAGLQTVFTSNYSIAGASDRLGEDKASAVEDRLRGRCIIVKLGGDSRR